MDDDSVAEALAAVAAALPAGEDRPGQVAMAQAVAAAIRDRKHLVVQAGTGTGKSLAYLVPCILLGEKVVISTATKALQDQLAGKDLPFLQQHLGMPFEFAVLKGRSNYLCRQRAAEVMGGDGQLALDEVDSSTASGLTRQILNLLKWAETSPTGDRAELDFEPNPRAWSNVSVSAMECPGAAKCPKGEVCFAEAARKRAEQADIVVVNSHLYGAHLASDGHVLPIHDVVVFDEAHELEDIAATSLGLELGAGRFRALVRTMRPVVDSADMDKVEHLDEAGDRFERAIEPFRGQRLPAKIDGELALVITGAAERVAAALGAVRKSSAGAEDTARKNRALQAGGHLGGDLAFVNDLPGSHVAWVEGPPHAPVLKVAAVDVGAKLNQALWGEVTGILTSATIPPRMAERVGLPDATSSTLDVGSPFSFKEQALLYCPDLPEPRSPAYEQAMHDELLALMQAAGGRTLALFTSWRAMQAVAEALSPKVAWRILRQDELPKPALVKAFTTDESSCLFATMGFWQGVDVPGAACSVVAIDRIPFPRPDEPLMQARRDRAGAAAFGAVDLPRATLLAQGAGRLIRTTTDRGVVAVLDSRLAVARYKPELLASLPPMKRTRTRSEVEAFLAPLLASDVTTIRAIIFDFDGLILDTEVPSFRAWQELYHRHGAELDESDWHAAIGTRRGVDPYELLVERATVPVPSAAEIHAVRNERKLELTHAEEVLPGVIEWIEDALRFELSLGVASTSPADWVEPHLQRLGLREHFHVVSCWDEHLKPKPAPDVYLAALDALAVDPPDAVAVEDSPNGVAAAKAAGLFCVAVPNTLTKPLDFSEADVVVDSLAELPLPKLLERLQ